jgi:hypothetical protein
VGEGRGKFYRAVDRRGPSDRRSAFADDSRDAYAGRTQCSPFSAFRVSFQEKKDTEIIALLA